MRERLAAGARLVTLTGPAGSGKTRVAAQIAGEAPDAWCFVDLSGVTSAAELVAGVAAALGGARVEAALAASPRDMVLDKCEQVAEAVAERCVAWLGAFPSVRVLATSRVRLRLLGEQVLQVGPLTTEDAVRLFEERARAADDTFDAARSREDVTAVVEALDCLPLAVELTAARVRLLPPRVLRARFLGLGDPAMDTTVSRSWGLLEAWERDVLADLSVFRGGAVLGAVSEVVRLPAGVATVDALQRLLDHSLLRVDAREAEPRYAPWAPVQAFARARLAEDPIAEAATLSRHARWCARLGPPGLGGHPSLRPDLPNLLLAAEAFDADVAVAAGLRAVTVLCETGPVEEAEALVHRLLLRATPALVPWARLVLARVVQFAGRLEDALRFAEEVLADPRAVDGSTGPLLLAAAHLRAGTAALNLGRVADASEHLAAAVPGLAEAGESSLHTSALLLLGVAKSRVGARAEAARFMREALASARSAGDVHSADTVRRALARVQMRTGQARAAGVTFRSLCVTQPSSVLDFHLASAIFLQGRFAEAVPLLDAVAADTARRGLLLHPVSALLLSALCALELGDDAALARICDRSEALLTEVDHPNDPMRCLRAVQLARSGAHAAARDLVAASPILGGGDPLSSPPCWPRRSPPRTSPRVTS